MYMLLKAVVVVVAVVDNIKINIPTFWDKCEKNVISQVSNNILFYITKRLFKFVYSMTSQL